MRIAFILPILAGIAALTVGAWAPGWVFGSQETGAVVTMFDNNAASPGQRFDPPQGWWSYAPYHVQVKRGEAVVFINPASNMRPHTVTSISRPSGATFFDAPLAAGALFDSSPNQQAIVAPGNSWTLDTSSLTPGNYAYYCRLHIWMLGSLSVTE